MSDASIPSSRLTRLEAAFVRALSEEVRHYAPSDPTAAALVAQLEEEERRLAELVASEPPGPTDPEPSGTLD